MTPSNPPHLCAATLPLASPRFSLLVRFSKQVPIVMYFWPGCRRRVSTNILIKGLGDGFAGGDAVIFRVQFPGLVAPSLGGRLETF